jgi:hypothetical protein
MMRWASTCNAVGAASAHRKAILGIIGLALLAMSGPAPADTIIYDSALQGQLDIFGNPIKLQLVPGIDVVRGSFLWANGMLLFGDGFGFIVPQDYAIDGISYAYSDLSVTPNVFAVGIIPELAGTGPDGTFNKSHSFGALCSEAGGHPSYIYNNGVIPTVPPVTASPINSAFCAVVNDNITSTPISIGAGLNWLFIGGTVSEDSRTPFSISWDYSIALDVEPASVPTPSTFPLFATGLGLMAFLMLRRQRRAMS